MTDPATLKDSRRTYRFWVDDTLFDHFGPRIGPYAIAVYCYLCRRATDSHSWPGMARIARDTGMSRDSVIRALKILETSDLLTIQRRYASERIKDTNFYTINDLSYMHSTNTNGHTPPSRSQQLPSRSQQLPLVAHSDYPGRSQRHKGFSGKDTQGEGDEPTHAEKNGTNVPPRRLSRQEEKQQASDDASRSLLEDIASGRLRRNGLHRRAQNGGTRVSGHDGQSETNSILDVPCSPVHH